MRYRNRTPSQIIYYDLYSYFLWLSFRNATKAHVSFLQLLKISHVQFGTGFKNTDLENIKRIIKSKNT